MAIGEKPDIGSVPPFAGFNNLPDDLILPLMAAIWEKTRRWADRQLKTLGLTFAQYVGLAALSQAEGISQRELARAMDIDTTTMTVVCDSLEKKKLIRRQREPADRRINRLYLTDAGREAYLEALPRIQEGSRSILSGIPPESLEHTMQTLWMLFRNVVEHGESGE